jgi:hypothetical protein
MARLPFVQVDTDFITHGAAALAAILGPDVAPAVAGWAVLQLRTWALSRASDADALGFIPGEHVPRLVATFAGWRGDPAAFLAALCDPAVQLAEVRPDGVQLLGLERDARVAARMRRERTNYPHLYEVEDVSDPVVVPRFRIRLKTPEERAQAEAEHARMVEATRQRSERERSHREEMKAAKRAAARVYFIQQDGGDRLVKIGTTCRPVEVRLRELQAGQPHPLVILAHAPGGRYDEGRLHDRFGPHRVTGEWFRPDAALLGYAATVGKAGIL